MIATSEGNDIMETRIITFSLFLAGCCGKICELHESARAPAAPGGGQDEVVIGLPFAQGDSYRCSQGPGGDYSHESTSTRYDADFDTPNDADIAVFAPVGGVVSVFDSNPLKNFGNHVNIDIGDGTYIIMAHLADIFVEDGSEVAAGQLIGFEGTTGNSTGDHLHVGRHDGDPELDGIYGTSIEGLAFDMIDTDSGGIAEELAVTDLSCNLTTGHVYESILPVTQWHPDGTLVKTPESSAVYLIEDGRARTFITEGAFLTRNYSFDDVVLITDDELDCYEKGEGLSDDTEIFAVVGEEPDEGVWILIGLPSDDNRYRLQVPTSGWQGVLKTWGVTASTYDDLPHDSDWGGIIHDYHYAGTATYRDGSLVSPVGASDVYYMSGGVAMPVVSWDTYLMLGLWSRQVTEIDEWDFETAVVAQGDCDVDLYCITADDITTCGGKNDDEDATFFEAGGAQDDPVDPEEEEAVEPADEEDDPADEGAGEQLLTLIWTTPSLAKADRITLSGEFTDADGTSTGWTELAEVYSTSSISYSQTAEAGATLRFSVEFEKSGSKSWSCLAPFPPGIVQGSTSASWNGVVQTVAAADDPSSDGCGLMITLR